MPDPYADLTLEELVARARDGDSGAFARLHDRYLDDVYRYVYLRVGGADLAEDLTAAAMLRAHTHIAAFRWLPYEIGAWLVLAARMLIEEHYGVGRYRVEVDDIEDLDPALLDSLRRLPSDQQECLSLRFLQGFSVAATARILEIKQPAVAILQWQALRAMTPDVGLELLEPRLDERSQASGHSQESAV